MFTCLVDPNMYTRHIDHGDLEADLNFYIRPKGKQLRAQQDPHSLHLTFLKTCLHVWLIQTCIPTKSTMGISNLTPIFRSERRQNSCERSKILILYIYIS